MHRTIIIMVAIYSVWVWTTFELWGMLLSMPHTFWTGAPLRQTRNELQWLNFLAWRPLISKDIVVFEARCTIRVDSRKKSSDERGKVCQIIGKSSEKPRGTRYIFPTIKSSWSQNTFKMSKGWNSLAIKISQWFSGSVGVIKWLSSHDSGFVQTNKEDSQSRMDTWTIRNTVEGKSAPEKKTVRRSWVQC